MTLVIVVVSYIALKIMGHYVLFKYRIMTVLRVSILLALILLVAGCSSISKPSVQLPAVSQDTRGIVKSLLKQYQQWKGVKYRYGGLSKSGIDCSGLVFLTFRDQFKVTLPRSTQQQAEVGTHISIAELRPGDLVLFKIGFSGRHIGIYAGEQKFLHASTSRGVIFSRLDSSYWKESFWQARRVM